MPSTFADNTYRGGGGSLPSAAPYIASSNAIFAQGMSQLGEGLGKLAGGYMRRKKEKDLLEASVLKKVAVATSPAHSIEDYLFEKTTDEKGNEQWSPKVDDSSAMELYADIKKGAAKGGDLPRKDLYRLSGQLDAFLEASENRKIEARQRVEDGRAATKERRDAEQHQSKLDAIAEQKKRQAEAEQASRAMIKEFKTPSERVVKNTSTTNVPLTGPLPEEYYTRNVRQEELPSTPLVLNEDQQPSTESEMLNQYALMQRERELLDQSVSSRLQNLTDARSALENFKPTPEGREVSDGFRMSVGSAMGGYFGEPINPRIEKYGGSQLTKVRAKNAAAREALQQRVMEAEQAYKSAVNTVRSAPDLQSYDDYRSMVSSSSQPRRDNTVVDYEQIKPRPTEQVVEEERSTEQVPVEEQISNLRSQILSDPIVKDLPPSLQLQVVENKINRAFPQVKEMTDSQGNRLVNLPTGYNYAPTTSVSAEELRQREKFKDYNRSLTAKGRTGRAYSPEDAKVYRQKEATLSNAIAGVNDLIEMIGRVSSLNLEDKAKASAHQSMLKGSLRTEIVGPGAVTETEQKLLESVIANPTAFFSLKKSNEASLQTLKKILERSLENAAVAAGYEPSQPSEQSQGSSEAGRQKTASNGVTYTYIRK